MLTLEKTIEQLLAKPKGILAADESTPSMNKRLAKVGVAESEEMRRQFRELLITTAGTETFLSGIILYDETIRQADSSGKKFTDILKDKGILIGIKVDEGTVAMPDSPYEVTTKGVAGLAKRLPEYREMGASFAKWRSVIRIGQGIPTKDCLAQNAAGLSQYAAKCQKAGLVPIIEPEVLLNGSHSLEQAEEVTALTLKTVFKACKKSDVELTGVILKSSMVLPGNESGTEPVPQKTAEATVRCFGNSVPKEVPGIVFLSGGQTPWQATENLNAIAKLEPQPWQLTFSYSRALEEPVLEAWQGKKENIAKAQQIFYDLCERNSKASVGRL